MNATALYDNRGMTTAREVQQADRQPQISEWVQAVEKEIAQLESMVENLQQRATPICRQQVPAPCDKVGQPDEVLVPLADKLRSLQRRIRTSAYVIQDLHDRIEL